MLFTILNLNHPYQLHQLQYPRFAPDLNILIWALVCSTKYKQSSGQFTTTKVRGITKSRRLIIYRRKVSFDSHKILAGTTRWW